MSPYPITFLTAVALDSCNWQSGESQANARRWTLSSGAYSFKGLVARIRDLQLFDGQGTLGTRNQHAIRTGHCTFACGFYHGVRHFAKLQNRLLLLSV